MSLNVACCTTIAVGTYAVAVSVSGWGAIGPGLCVVFASVLLWERVCLD